MKYILGLYYIVQDYIFYVYNYIIIWMDRWMDRWIDGWMDGQSDRGMDGTGLYFMYIYIY